MSNAARDDSSRHSGLGGAIPKNGEQLPIAMGLPDAKQRDKMAAAFVRT